MQPFLWRRSRSTKLCRATVLILLLAFISWTVIHIQTNWFESSPPTRRILRLRTDDLPVPDQSTLLDLNNFRFTLQSEVCHPMEDIYLLTLVHSTPTHVEQRAVIRSTWGGVKNVSGRAVRTVFLTGASSSTSAQQQLREENKIYGDVIQGNFVDSYNNLTYKHLMGLKWSLTHCNTSRFILKVDEDAYVDTYQFVDFLVTVYGENSVKILMCHVYSEGTEALRAGKWAVSKTDYPHENYPRYCAGLAYVISFDVVRDLVIASNYVPFFWIDDVYVTGLLAETVGLRHLSMNLRMSLDLLPLKHWLGDGTKYPCRFFIGNLGDITNWSQLLKDLWLKTLHAHTILK